MIHLIGMGVSGCLLANVLHKEGVDFTWFDKDVPRTAWKASTGAIYPSGSLKFGPDEECRAQWAKWHEEQMFPGCTEEATYVFNHKSPPHEGRYAFARNDSNLAVASVPSFHLNAQKLVEETRRKFSHLNTGTADMVYRCVYTHGFTERLSHVYWGWTRVVRLEWDGEYLKRPCFYFRQGRFIMAYAYPIPGTPYWYAGSSIIKQKLDSIKSLDIESKYDRWKVNFETLSNNSVRVVEEREMIEGWRPAAAPNDDAWVTKDMYGDYQLRPLWNSGIRHFPKQLEELRKVL